MIATSQLILFMSAALLLLLIPGPAVLYITTRSATQGRVAGLVSVLAIETANLIQAIADRKSTRLNSSHIQKSRMPSSA